MELRLFLERFPPAGQGTYAHQTEGHVTTRQRPTTSESEKFDWHSCAAAEVTAIAYGVWRFGIRLGSASVARTLSAH
jgi:hypothetical protein